MSASAAVPSSDLARTTVATLNLDDDTSRALYANTLHSTTLIVGNRYLYALWRLFIAVSRRAMDFHSSTVVKLKTQMAPCSGALTWASAST